jgi:hypothetical protein
MVQRTDFSRINFVFAWACITVVIESEDIVMKGKICPLQWKGMFGSVNIMIWGAVCYILVVADYLRDFYLEQ